MNRETQRKRIGINGLRRDQDPLVKLAALDEWRSMRETGWKTICG